MLAKKYHPEEAEAKWQKFWEETGVYKFDSEGVGQIFSIDTPPPTVSGAIHIGHIYSYTHTEIIARYSRMRGYRVFYPFGFDDNGLPTERLVEKEIGMKAQELDRKEYTQHCLQITEKYEADFKELWQSMGFSVDWDLEYSTIDEKSQQISQLSFLDLYHKKRAYRAKNPVIWCSECRTSIAQAEIEVKEKKTKLNFILFSTTTGEDLAIATTRPELLPACVAVFVHPQDQRYLHLIGKNAINPLTGEEIKIIIDEEVEIDKGTGAVMCCTFGDQQDIIWWKRYQLSLKEIINESGEIRTGRYSGMKLVEARKAILADLRSIDRLIKQQEITHQVAHHERCGQPIEFLSSEQWFIKIMDKKTEFLKLADQINWYPANMKYRYLDWVKNLEWDWCISRQRYFGVPFPIWYCEDCGEIIPASTEELPINPLESKPKQPCKCGSKKFIPEKDVMDTWATSSVTPLINADWQGSTKTKYPILPMSLRPQAHEIIRTWAFYTIVKSYYHFNQVPWKDIMISGFVMAKKGEKISKSKGNSKNSPRELIQKYSADVIRLWSSQAKLGTDIFFTEDELKNNSRLPIKLWNAARFVLGHLKDFSQTPEIKYELMDQWMLLKMSQIHHQVSEALERYQISQARAILDKFFWNDFCDNYLEIVKERLYKPDLRGEEKRLSAQQSLYQILLNILKMYAIYMPHITEEIYQSYFRDQEQKISIHLLNWNKYSKLNFSKYFSSIDLNERGDEFINIAAMVRKFKSENALSLGAEITMLTIYGSPESISFLEQSKEDLKAVTRANQIIFETSQDQMSIKVNSFS